MLMEMNFCTRDQDVMHGALCFAGTRVPIETLFEYLEEGESIDAFLEGFPTVSREQAIAVLEESRKLVAKAQCENSSW